MILVSVLPSPLLSPLEHPRSRGHIFISYDHDDRPLVEKLSNDLRDRGHTVWIDFNSIRGGDFWQKAIVEGISASAVVLVVLSPDSVRSEWVAIEVETARQFHKKIVPLLVRSLSTPEDQAAYHQLNIDHIQYRKFTDGYEIAFSELLADLPYPMDGVAGHCQKIVAWLAALPWGIDHYIQEEAKLLPLNASRFGERAGTDQIENLLHRLRAGHRLLVLGEPGIGKTVALERLAWELASANPLVVPIIVRLFRYRGEPLLEWIRVEVIQYREIRLLNIEDTRRWLADVPFECYFLLDGLNEAPPKYKEYLVSEIIRLGKEFSRHRLVVTSRVQDEGWQQLYDNAQDSDLGSAAGEYEAYLVRPIRPEQSRAYLEAHLGVEDGQAIWSQLDTHMRGLVTTPLLLWLIKEACQPRNQDTIRVPNNRGELYKSFVNRMLQHDDKRQPTNDVTVKTRLEILERLALVMHSEKSLTIALDRALSIVGEQNILRTLLLNGLLLQVGEQLRFAPHHTFQEHFAACAMLDEVRSRIQSRGIKRLAERFWSGIIGKARDPWWAETFIQLAGLIENPNALARAVAEVNPWLAWWCVKEGREVDQATEQVIRQRSEALIHSSKVKDRRRAAQALSGMQTERAIAPLTQLIADEDPEVGEIVVQSLLGYVDAAVPLLVRLLDNPSTLLGQCRAGCILAKSLDSQVAEPLNSLKEKLTPQILTQIHDLGAVPVKRLEFGRFLAEFGDPRPGVGLRSDGLPDIDWVEIPEGEFIYQEQKRLTLPIFYISRYPITYVQFQSFIDASDGFHNPYWWEELSASIDHRHKPGDQKFKYANHPREMVSWYDAVAFCRWLSARRNLEIRLPLEREWEKAARGNDGRRFPWGNRYVSGYANVDETLFPNRKLGPHSLKRTTAVGIYPQGASPYGVLDMCGNTMEWCLSDDHYSKGKKRIARGEPWIQSPDNGSLTSRWVPEVSDREPYIGFRVVCPHLPHK